MTRFYNFFKVNHGCDQSPPDTNREKKCTQGSEYDPYTCRTNTGDLSKFLSCAVKPRQYVVSLPSVTALVIQAETIVFILTNRTFQGLPRAWLNLKKHNLNIPLERRTGHTQKKKIPDMARGGLFQKKR